MQIGQIARYERDHRPQQDHPCQRRWMKQQRRPGDVRAVRIPNRDHVLWLKPIMHRRRCDEAHKLLRAKLEVLFVEDAFSESSKEARHAVLDHLSARAEQIGARRDRAPDAHQIALVSTRAVEQKQRRRGKRLARFESMDKAKIHGSYSIGSFGDVETSVVEDAIGLVCNRDAFCFMSANSRSMRSVRDLLCNSRICRSVRIVVRTRIVQITPAKNAIASSTSF